MQLPRIAPTLPRFERSVTLVVLFVERYARVSRDSDAGRRCTGASTHTHTHTRLGRETESFKRADSKPKDYLKGTGITWALTASTTLLATFPVTIMAAASVSMFGGSGTQFKAKPLPAGIRKAATATTTERVCPV